VWLIFNGQTIESYGGHGPGRRSAISAPQFWNQAMALLQEKEVIGRWKEIDPLPAGTRNWKKAFREQQLEILPSAAGRQVIKEIATAKKVAAKRTRRKAKPAP
jgi:hypothetical protein